jgi:hypothetical protein
MYNCHQDMDDDDDSGASSDGEAMDDDSNGTSASSYEPSMRSAASRSVVSITSAVQLFKESHGRLINTWGNIYALPGDAEEFSRLSKSDSTIFHNFH